MLHINLQAATISHRRVSLFCASMVLGLGIWAMHFIGMLAMHFPVAVSYDTGITALSILPGMLAAFLALWSLQRTHAQSHLAWRSGLTVGLGIAAMHYSGIAAMQVDALVRFVWPWFVLSLALGLVFAILAFQAQRWMFNHESSELATRWGLLPSALMTVAIASMHYLSIHAMELVLVADTPPPLPQLPAAFSKNIQLSLLVAGMAAVIFLIFGLANALLRYRDLWQAVAVRDARLNAMIETAPDGVITINEQGLIQDFNPQAQQIFGYAHEEVMGRNIACLMPSPLAEQHNSHLHKHLDKPDKAISVNGREVLGQHKDGRLIPLQLAIGKAITSSGTIFVGYLQDISERKRTDAQLRIAASVFEHVREGIAIVDANHNISDANPAFLRLMEKTRDNCIGRSLESLYEDADIPPDMRKLWQTVATQHYWQSEGLFTRSDGTAWMQRMSISPVLNELKRPHHFIAVISDVSERPGLEVMLPHADLHDNATGLATHKLWMDRLSNGLLVARKKAMHIGVFWVQVTLAKGPASQPTTGDMTGALRLMAQLLQHQLRSSDTIGLYADHQLAVLLPGLKDEASFEMLVQRLTQAIGQSIAAYEKYGMGSIAVGHASTLRVAAAPSELIASAQAALVTLPAPPPAKVRL